MRRRLALLCLLAMTPLAVLMGWWLMPEPRVTAANAERIRDGMTLEHVEELLGASEEGIQWWGGSPGDFDETGYNGIKIWKAGGCLLAVEFEGSRVRRKIFEEITLWQRIDDWFHGQERSQMGVYELCSR